VTAATDTETGVEPPLGPVVFAYDGSELAKLAIDEAARQLGPGRDAVVLTVWQPFNVGFVPTVALRLNAAEIADVRRAAQENGRRRRLAREGGGLSTRAARRSSSVLPGRASSTSPRSTTRA